MKGETLAEQDFLVNHKWTVLPAGTATPDFTLKSTFEHDDFCGLTRRISSGPRPIEPMHTGIDQKRAFREGKTSVKSSVTVKTGSPEQWKSYLNGATRPANHKQLFVSSERK